MKLLGRLQYSTRAYNHINDEYARYIFYSISKFRSQLGRLRIEVIRDYITN